MHGSGTMMTKVLSARIFYPAVACLLTACLFAKPLPAASHSPFASQEADDTVAPAFPEIDSQRERPAATVDPFFNFVTESAWNPIGGRKEGTAYNQQVDFGANVDLDTLLGVPDTKFHLRLSDRVGQSLSLNAIGSDFSAQEIYGAGQTFRLSIMNVSHAFAGAPIVAKIGWSPLGSDFQTSDGCGFQINFFCGHANVLTKNSGAHNFPTGDWNV